MRDLFTSRIWSRKGNSDCHQTSFLSILLSNQKSSKMGDIRILDPRFGADMKHHRPWPSIYRNHSASRGPSFCYRPMPMDTLTQWVSPMANHEYNYVPARVPGSGSNKGGDYYYLTPMYRNALPPPPPQAMPGFQVPNPVAVSPRMMMVDQQQHQNQHHYHRPSRNRSTKSSGSAGMGGRHSVPPCTCVVGRTRSLEDVRSEISEWEEYCDVNGNRLRASPKSNGISKANGRRSMENLLEVDVEEGGRGFENGMKPLRNGRIHDKPGKRRGSYMVRAVFPLITTALYLRSRERAPSRTLYFSCRRLRARCE